MTKIQELAERAKGFAAQIDNSAAYFTLIGIIDELAGIAESLDATWHDHEAVPEEVIHEGERQGYSDDVLIDLDGHRKDYAIGWYDFDTKEWALDSEKFTQDDIDHEHMSWRRLPLAKYDKS